MRIAVLSCTRDRLTYSKHCYATLLDHAGCDFDLYVTDQASRDGTVEWLQGLDATVTYRQENVGLCRALNWMLDHMLDPDLYDVIVRWDNDCELTQPDTLKDVCEAADEFGWILAPQVKGLRNPPAMGPEQQMGAFTVRETATLGGIFMAVPSDLFTDFGFRYDETQPVWAGDELICPWWRSQGGHCGYLTDYVVNHYLSTDGQAADIPDYFHRRVLEGGPAL